jgi:protein-arginine kinase activator protein McsA
VTDDNRCDECGGWDARCVYDEAQPRCGCARCANARASNLIQTLKLVQKWIGRSEWSGEGMAEMFRTITMVQKTLDLYGEKK